MPDFIPIDHKESDVEYVALVRNSVAKRLKTTLENVDDPSFLVGRWRSSLSRRSASDYDFEHLADGTFASRDATSVGPAGRWKLEGGAYVVTSWCPPLPEDKIDEGFWEAEAFRCAKTGQGQIVYWNGDGSLVVTLTRVPNRKK